MPSLPFLHNRTKYEKLYLFARAVKSGAAPAVEKYYTISPAQKLLREKKPKRKRCKNSHLMSHVWRANETKAILTDIRKINLFHCARV